MRTAGGLRAHAVLALFVMDCFWCAFFSRFGLLLLLLSGTLPSAFEERRPAFEESGTGKPVWDSNAADVENGFPTPRDATEDADDV